jgi:hypothetical protein
MRTDARVLRMGPRFIIAESFAKQDSRIRIHNNTEFLSVVDNHNNAFSLIPDRAKYCKVVGADDWLYPNRIAEMVKLAEQYPSVGMVTSYVLCGNRVGWDGLPYPSTFMKGRDVCRLRLVKGLKVFGGPSASLLRCSVVKEYQPFYKLGNYHGDTEAYLDLLQKYDFGFLHQVLSYNRKGGGDSRTTGYLQRVNSYPVADIEELVRFGPIYLTEEEQKLRLGQDTKRYYQFLTDSVLEQRNKEFWDYHRGRMKELGPEFGSGSHPRVPRVPPSRQCKARPRLTAPGNRATKCVSGKPTSWVRG